MKIIIAGAGAVGTHLAQLLAKESLNITLMDENEEARPKMADHVDLMTLNVSPTSIGGLKEAGAAHADLFIAVTPNEMKNITCCMLAHSLGAQKTVARIDNAEYLDNEYKPFFKSIGISSLIFPEILAAREIVESIKYSWVRQWWEVHNGALVMLGIKLRDTADILNIPLKTLCGPDTCYHIVAIKRDDATIIPNGETTLQLHDIAYFMTTKKHIPYIRKIVGKEHYADVRNVMIMGGGRTAMHTALNVPGYMEVKIIESDPQRCNELNEALGNNDVMVINGDARDSSLLVTEGIQHTQAFVALTGQSESNILACLAAKRLGVRKTVALVDNFDYISMAEKLDIGTIINKKTIAASHIYQMMLDADVSNVKCLTVADADVAEFEVKANAKVTKKPVKDLGLPTGVTIGGLVRNGEGMHVNGMTQIQEGDSVVVFCQNMFIKKLDKFFA
ncbi:MAG: Trk system potassium transporter TrkA [Paraprevotella sp.]|nr:Trk system potassium transporter TrkA [Paraprevotella sp.]